MDEKSGTKQKIVSMVLLGFSLLYLCSGFRLKIGTLRSPGPGFFPLIVGTCLTILTIAFFIRTFRPKSSEKAGPGFVGEICQIAEGDEKSFTAAGDEICRDAVIDEVPRPSGEGREEKKGIPREVIAVVAASFLYPVILVPLKFVLATFLVCFGMLLAFKPQRPILSFVLSLVLAFGCFFFFGRFFGVPLPSGFLEVLLYQVGG